MRKTAILAFPRLLRELAVFFGFLAGATVFTFPSILDLRRAVVDLADPLLDAWAFAWTAHQLPRDPIHLFDSNRYYPETGTLAFTDPMIGLGIVVSPVQALFDEPVLTLNVAILFSLALSGYGAYLLVKDMTGSAAAGGVAGAIFAFNPYRLSHLEHVQLQAAGYIPLFYFCLRRYLRDGRPRQALGVGAFLWLVSASCAYYGMFTWTLLGLAAPYEVWRTSAFHRPRRLAGLGLALALSAAAYLPLAIPFMRLEQDFGFERPLARLERASARPADYLRSGAHLHRALGLPPESPERTLFPGILAVGLGSLALLKGNRNTGMYALLGALAAWGSLGPAYGLYRMLHATVPGMSGLRVPPRFAIYVLFALSVLAGWGAAWVLRRIQGKGRKVVAAALVVFPLAESFGGPVPYRKAPEPPPVYEWLARQPDPAPVLELPAAEANVHELHRNAIYLFWSASHFKPVVNGYSTLIPPVYAELTEVLEDFPSSTAVDALARLRVRFVILHRDLYLRHRAQRLERAIDAQPGLEQVHRTENETVYEVTASRESPRIPANRRPE